MADLEWRHQPDRSCRARGFHGFYQIIPKLWEVVFFEANCSLSTMNRLYTKISVAPHVVQDLAHAQAACQRHFDLHGGLEA